MDLEVKKIKLTEVLMYQCTALCRKVCEGGRTWNLSRLIEGMDEIGL